MSARATDEQLERFAAFLAKVTLEIERDLRKPELLLEVMPTRTWEQWQRSRLPGKFAGGPVMDADIGTPRIQRLDDTRAIANVVTRTDPQRWGALTMNLDASTGRWRAASIQRLYAARHYRTAPDRSGRESTAVAVPLDQRLATARNDRQQATAALNAVTRRASELPELSDGRHHAAELSTTWKNIIADLDREIATLLRQQRNGLTANHARHRVLKI